MPRVREHQAVYKENPKRTANPPVESLSPRMRVTSLLATMKDSATYEDIAYRVYVLHNLGQGEKDFREGRVFSNEEVEKMLDKWLK